MLSLTRQPVVSVSEELNALGSYTFLMRMRFENSFTITVSKIADCERNGIIPLTLQLLAENAFKDNIATEESPLNIKIIVNSDYIRVENNIQSSNDADKGGIGLKYITRLYKLYAKDIVIEYTGHMFTVKIPYIQPCHEISHSRR